MNYQYADWKAIKEEIDDENFDLLAIPTNHFNLQEPGRNDEIMNLLRYVRPGNDFIPNYRVTAKHDINGDDEEELYTFLKTTCPGPRNLLGPTEFFYWTPIKQHDITWNFEKILVGADGKPVKRYNPVTQPNSVKDDILEQLEIAKNKKSSNQTVKKSKILQGMAKKHNNPKP